MNTKVLIAALVGGITSFLLGWVFYGLLLRDFFAANAGSATGVMKDDASMNWLPIVVGNMTTGLLFALIFKRWAGITTFKTGAIGGAWVGLLIALSYDMISLGTTNMMNTAAALVDPLVSTVMGAITGGMVGWALGYGNRT